MREAKRPHKVILKDSTIHTPYIKNDPGKEREKFCQTDDSC